MNGHDMCLRMRSKSQNTKNTLRCLFSFRYLSYASFINRFASEAAFKVTQQFQRNPCFIASQPNIEWLE